MYTQILCRMCMFVYMLSFYIVRQHMFCGHTYMCKFVVAHTVSIALATWPTQFVTWGLVWVLGPCYS